MKENPVALVRIKIGQLTLLARSIILIVLAREQDYCPVLLVSPVPPFRISEGFLLLSAALKGLNLMLAEKCLLMEM